MSTSEILRRDRKRKRRLKRRRERRQQRIAELRERWTKSGPDDLLDELAACVYIGGSKPIDAATLWRGVKRGDYSKPDKIAAQLVRWRRTKLAADLDRMATERDSDTVKIEARHQP
jgi:hypothetical protein